MLPRFVLLSLLLWTTACGNRATTKPALPAEAKPRPSGEQTPPAKTRLVQLPDGAVVEEHLR